MYSVWLFVYFRLLRSHSIHRRRRKEVKIYWYRKLAGSRTHHKKIIINIERVSFFSHFHSLSRLFLLFRSFQYSVLFFRARKRAIMLPLFSCPSHEQKVKKKKLHPMTKHSGLSQLVLELISKWEEGEQKFYWIMCYTLKITCWEKWISIFFTHKHQIDEIFSLFEERIFAQKRERRRKKERIQRNRNVYVSFL